VRVQHDRRSEYPPLVTIYTAEPAMCEMVILAVIGSASTSAGDENNHYHKHHGMNTLDSNSTAVVMVMVACDYGGIKQHSNIKRRERESNLANPSDAERSCLLAQD
jgi:hypothetical protein